MSWQEAGCKLNYKIQSKQYDFYSYIIDCYILNLESCNDLTLPDTSDTIEVEDNGPGIDEDLRKKIFYPMITTRSEGNGLGLSIAQALISRHEGLIECDSSPDGSTFTILLPLEKIQDA